MQASLREATTVQSRRTGSAILGVPGEEGELVSFDTTLEHDGETVISFIGVVTSLTGKRLNHLYGRDLILDIDGGPAIDVIIVQFDEDDAIIQLNLIGRGR